MFNLEQSISEWRQQMLAAGIKTPVPQEELESHLREEIQRQMESGMNPQDALEAAMKIIGNGPELGKEFKKGEPLEARAARLVAAGCLAIACLGSIQSLLVLLFTPFHGITYLAGLLAFAAIILGLKYNYKLLPVIPNQPARAIIGFIGCAGAVVWINLFIKYLLVELAVGVAGAETRDQLVTGYLWAWTAMALLAGIGNGLEKAARTRTATVGS
jgi:hypothetical protein